MNVDHKAGSAKHPVGWLNLQREFEKPLDLSDARAVKMEIRFHQEGCLRFGLRTRNAPTENWLALWPPEAGKWQTAVVPLAAIEPASRREVTGLTFYVAENWYADGEKLTFDLRDVRICR